MGQKILLVDDDPAFTDLYSAIFSKNNFNYSIAKDGLEALEKATAERPDLILLDIMMPGMSGFDVIKKLKQNPQIEKIPVWMITNLAEQMNKTTAASLGATDYLVKSAYTPNQVIEKIRKFFEAQDPTKPVKTI